MAKSRAQKGNYYKLKTKKWFLDKGYACEYLEKMQRIFTKKGIIFIKKDVFGADGVAMNKDEIIFWNSKFGRSNISAGIKEFEQFPYPKSVKRWVVVWGLREREPEIHFLEDEEKSEEVKIHI
jgi:hypothetical protein